MHESGLNCVHKHIIMIRYYFYLVHIQKHKLIKTDSCAEIFYLKDNFSGIHNLWMPFLYRYVPKTIRLLKA